VTGAFGAKLIMQSGNEEQKKKYLIPVYTGEIIPAGGFTEPDRGSDLVTGPLSTTAERTGIATN
jgi:alkylation response protein AidB-like acyl-CoA dehydrogenase